MRSVGKELEFAGYPGKLPRGLVLGEPRAAVAKKLGAPATSDGTDRWPSAKLVIACDFARGKLVEVYFGQPKQY